MSLTLHDRAGSFASAFPDVAKYGGGLHVAPSAQGFDKFFATWTGGADYRNKSKLYGAFPPYFLPRVFSIFPDARRILHLFSGSLTAEQVKKAWDQVWPSSVKHVDSEGREVASMAEAMLLKGWSLSTHPVMSDGRYITPPTQIRFDNGLHPAAKAAKPDIIGDAECLSDAVPVEPRRVSGVVRAPFDLVIADPPYRLADQRRYWREAMFSLDRCRHDACGAPPEAHWPVYVRSTLREVDEGGSASARRAVRDGGIRPPGLRPIQASQQDEGRQGVREGAPARRTSRLARRNLAPAHEDRASDRGAHRALAKHDASRPSGHGHGAGLK